MAHTVDVSTWIISCKCKLMAKKGRNHLLLSFSCFTLLIAQSYSQIEVLLQDQLKDGNELFSASGKFKLGFFSPSNSTERYLGLMYNIPRERDFFYKPGYGRSSADVIVWVANRDDPILDRSGSLRIDSTDGNLKIFHSRGSPVAVSRVKGARNTSAFLLKNGNFVLREMNLNGSVKQVVWQSFDYPTDTLLPGMKLGINLQTEQSWSLQSWWTDNSPAPGSFTLGMDPNVSDRLIIWWRGQVFCSLVWQSGHFNFSYSYLNGIKSYDFRYTSNEQEKYFSYSLIDDATSFPMLQLKNDGNFYDDSGFPVSLNFWDEKGPLCRRDLQSFEDKLGFMSGEGSKLEGSDNMTFFDCAVKCIYDCSCVAISVRDKYVNTGCEIWSREAKFTESNKGDPLTVYFLVYTEKKWWIWLIIAVELGILKFCLCYLTWKKYKAKEKKWWIWLIVAVVLVILMFCLCYLTWRKYKANEENWWLPLTVAVGAVLLAPLFFYLCCMMWRKLKANVEHKIHRKNQKKLLRELDDILLPHNMHGKGKGEGNDQSISNELKIFDFRAIVASTNNFATTNKLGEGGFGPVYKGRLLDDREIAIKRLSKRSGQGIVEFKNEVKLIAKLQHTNLVRLLGCALQGEERILVYEYMPNKSLDFFIFDSSRKNLLNWKKRFNIIEGIAQGLVYLHKYSRLRVIHRDLKASNILLDDQMNPKISDFGMARIFELNELEANTNRVVGTYGYMSSEYAMNGIVSIKTDVYSFGVLVLEIITGKKNNSSYHSERPLNLVGYVWELWNEGKGLELIDLALDESCCPEEALRCLHVGLLCVQDHSTDRPTMWDVVSMLTNHTLLLPAPKQPAFFIHDISQESEALEIKLENCSTNDVTISVMKAR